MRKINLSAIFNKISGLVQNEKKMHINSKWATNKILIRWNLHRVKKKMACGEQIAPPPKVRRSAPYCFKSILVFLLISLEKH
jgi:hypothetical protein